MELQGKIIAVLPAQSGIAKNGNPWKIQPYVLETLGQYPKKVYFEIFGEERINENQANVDDLVTVDLDIESREYNGKWFTSVRAWKMMIGVPLDAGKNTNVIKPDADTTNVVKPDADLATGGGKLPF